MKLNRTLLYLLPLLLMPAARAADTTAVVQWTARLHPADVRAGETAQVVLEAAIKPPWHVYSTKKYEIGPRATKAEIKSGTALTAAGPLVQPTPKKEMDPGFKIEVEYYEGGVAFGLPVKVAPAARGKQAATVAVTWQACEHGRCLRPKTDVLPVSFTVAAGPARASRTKAPTAAPPQPAAYKNPNKPRADAGMLLLTADESGESGRIREARQQGLLPFLGLSLLMGFLALLTPCVFPMIPITVSYFAKQHELNPRAGIGGPVAYSLGIIGTFTGLGVLMSAIFGPASVRNLATNPWMNLGLAVLFVAMALNLFGAFEIVLPSGLIQKTQSGAGRGGLIGPLLMGLTFTLTSFTCTVAFVGTLLATASTGDYLWPTAGMLAFSTAFASPFFLLALFPQWLARLPKAGGWLVTVKGFMGFLELAAAVKFFSNADLVWNLRLLTQPVFLAIWFGIITVAGCYLLGWIRLPHDAGGGIGFARRGLGLATVAAGVYLLAGINGRPVGWVSAFLPPEEYGRKHVSSPAAVEEVWFENYDQALAAAKTKGKPLFIDFTGVTCSNCRLMEATVFVRPEVKEEFKQFVTVRLYTDKEDAESQRYGEMQEQRFGQSTLPLYIVLSPEEVKLGEYSFNTDVPKFVEFLRGSRAKGEAVARS